MRSLLILALLAFVLCPLTAQALAADAPPAASSAEKPAAAAGKPAAPQATETKPAAGAAGQPAAEAAKPPVICCTVREITNTPEWRPTPQNPWGALKVGDQLTVGSDIRTGFRARCLLEFENQSSVVDVEPLTLLRLGEFVKDGDKVKTRLYLEQGGARSAVEKARVQSDFAIVTPEVTMAVRGTEVIEFHRWSDQGPVVFLTHSGRISLASLLTGQSQDAHPGGTLNSPALAGPSGILGPPGVNTWMTIAQALRNLQFDEAIHVFDLNGGLTHNEQIAILFQSQAFFGPPNQFAPNGQNNPGNVARTTTTGQQGTSQFLSANPQFLSALGLAPAGGSQPYTPPSPYGGYPSGYIHGYLPYTPPGR